MPQTITLRRPDDMHLHLRSGASLTRTVSDSARQFARAVIMPNLTPPIINLSKAQEYYRQIMAHVPKGANFKPLLTLYLTDQTSPKDVEQAYQSGLVVAAKLYPAGATTNSALGVTNLEKIYPVLTQMQDLGMPLLVHGEVVDFAVDIFEREQKFIAIHLTKLVKNFAKLKIVLEHITTIDAVKFVLSCGDNVGATITPQHLLYNRNHMLVGGIRPHLYCLPILKSVKNQQALIDAVLSANPKFFLGTDSAPHPSTKKEAVCGCAGCYSAFHALELYAEFFDSHNALDKLPAFASEFGAKFYGLELNQEFIKLKKQAWQVPEYLEFGEHRLVPLKALETLAWRFDYE